MSAAAPVPLGHRHHRAGRRGTAQWHEQLRRLAHANRTEGPRELGGKRRVEADCAEHGGRDADHAAVGPRAPRRPRPPGRRRRSRQSARPASSGERRPRARRPGPAPAGRCPGDAGRRISADVGQAGQVAGRPPGRPSWRSRSRRERAGRRAPGVISSSARKRLALSSRSGWRRARATASAAAGAAMLVSAPRLALAVAHRLVPQAEAVALRPLADRAVAGQHELGAHFDDHAVVELARPDSRVHAVARLERHHLDARPVELARGGQPARPAPTIAALSG